MYLILNQYNNHVSSDTINDFEHVVSNDYLVINAKKVNRHVFSVVFFLYRLSRKLGFSTIPVTKSRFLKSPLKDKKHLFTVMMGLDEAKYKPYGYTTCHCRSIYIFDAWEKDHAKISDFISKFKIDFLFVSSSQSTHLLKLKSGHNNIYWIPEGLNPEEYKHYPSNQKTIDVLALGRKYDLYHNLIREGLESKGYKYLYEKVKGEIIFPTRQEFIEGLAYSRISICFPSNITHPERAGNIETMTVRYLQSMVSKCLVLGHAPKEMIDLFGYNPVVEIDLSDPVCQIENILNNYEDYIPLIEKNYNTVVQNHTWEKRWQQIKSVYLQNTR